MRHASGFALFFVFVPGLAAAHPGDHNNLTSGASLQHMAEQPYHFAPIAGLVALVMTLVLKLRMARA